MAFFRGLAAILLSFSTILSTDYVGNIKKGDDRPGVRPDLSIPVLVENHANSRKPCH
jgi:hypothetical protein